MHDFMTEEENHSRPSKTTSRETRNISIAVPVDIYGYQAQVCIASTRKLYLLDYSVNQKSVLRTQDEQDVPWVAFPQSPLDLPCEPAVAKGQLDRWWGPVSP